MPVKKAPKKQKSFEESLWDTALKIDSALALVEKNNPSLKGALPDNYFSRLQLDSSKLAALIDASNNIRHCRRPRGGRRRARLRILPR